VPAPINDMGPLGPVRACRELLAAGLEPAPLLVLTAGLLPAPLLVLAAGLLAAGLLAPLLVVLAEALAAGAGELTVWLVNAGM
jgi:hypothetical protein